MAPPTFLYVTAFKDIGRASWDAFQQPTDGYRRAFRTLAVTGVDLVCFEDYDWLASPTVARPNLHVHPYGATFLDSRYLEREREIMGSVAYQSLLAHRSTFPEHSRPEYNLVNHNKVLFLRRARDLHPGYSHYVWIDYHFARHGTLDKALLNGCEHLPTDRVTISSFFHAYEFPKLSHEEFAIQSPDAMLGCLFVVPNAMVDTLHDAYVETLEDKYAAGIADDDQNVHAVLFNRRPDMYNLVQCARFEWGSVLGNMRRDWGYGAIPDNGDEFASKLRQNFHHFASLQRIVESVQHPNGEGSYMMDGRSLDYCPIMYPKQLSLFDAAKTARTRVNEIGVNAGHSLLILLLGLDGAVSIDAIDICQMRYTVPCVAHLQTQFPGRVQFLQGDSHRILEYMLRTLGSEEGRYDLVHVDGLHAVHHVKREIDLLKPMCVATPTWVMDDIMDLPGVHEHLQASYDGRGYVGRIPSCPWTHLVYSSTRA